jgi:hypothetical protein
MVVINTPNKQAGKGTQQKMRSHLGSSPPSCTQDISNLSNIAMLYIMMRKSWLT